MECVLPDSKQQKERDREWESVDGAERGTGTHSIWLSSSYDVSVLRPVEPERWCDEVNRCWREAGTTEKWMKEWERWMVESHWLMVWCWLWGGWEVERDGWSEGLGMCEKERERQCMCVCGCVCLLSSFSSPLTVSYTEPLELQWHGNLHSLIKRRGEKNMIKVRTACRESLSEIVHLKSLSSISQAVTDLFLLD